MNQILDVDLLAFEQHTGERRRAVVEGVRRSLATGFVYTRHDVSEDLLDTAYGMLADFFSLAHETKAEFTVPGAHGQTGYTGLLVETAASSDEPDWKEMLNWASPIAPGHPLQRKFPTAYPDQVTPESAVPGITDVLYRFHDAVADLQRRFLRVIAEGVGCHETFFDDMVRDGPTLTRGAAGSRSRPAPPRSRLRRGASGTRPARTHPRATGRHPARDRAASHARRRPTA
jgi:isopenicillin N synthase-like dioxygenase